MQLPKDIPIASFHPLRELKQGNDCRVDLVRHIESGAQYVLKTYDREKVLQNGSRIDQDERSQHLEADCWHSAVRTIRSAASQQHLFPKELEQIGHYD